MYIVNQPGEVVVNCEPDFTVDMLVLGHVIEYGDCVLGFDNKRFLADGLGEVLLGPLFFEDWHSGR